MNDETAQTTQEPSASAENAEPKDNSNGSSSPTNTAQGLLADVKKEDGAPTPVSEITDPSAAKDPDAKVDRPSYIAEQFWDTEKGVLKGEALGTAYNDLRKEFNKQSQEKGQQAPGKAEDYLLEYKPPLRFRPTGDQKEGDLLDRYGELNANDPVFIAMSKAAKSAKISSEQFNDLMQVAMEELHPILPAPFNPEKEKALLGEGAENMIKTNRDWIDTMVRNGIVNEDEFNLLLNFGATALGVQLTNKLRLNSGEKPIPTNLNGNANTGRKTPDECQAMMADERYYAEGSVGDAFRAEVDKAFAETFGTQPT